jgi:7-keto-8-aminopelargonate synthetase-like enzyme
VAGSLAALGVAKREPERCEALRSASRVFMERAKARGLDTGEAMGYGVVPVYFETPMLTALVSRALGEAGIYAPPIIQAGIKPNATRIRFFISTATRLEDIDTAIDVMATTVEALRRDGVA